MTHTENLVELNSISIMVIILHVSDNGVKEDLVIRDCWIKEDVHHILYLVQVLYSGI